MQFNENDFSLHSERYGDRDRYGQITVDDLVRASDRKVAQMVRAYGILTALLEESDDLGSQERVRNRRLLQELIKLRLGVPQYSRTDEGISFENVSKVGLVESGDALFSFISSFSPYDLFPLAANQEYLPDVKAPLQTFTLEFVIKPKGL